MKQTWVGSTDLNGMLCDVTGWQVGCKNAEVAREAIDHALSAKLIGYRMHYANAFPDGVQFYEVTDLGIAQIRNSYGDKAADSAAEQRSWYRENTSEPK